MASYLDGSFNKLFNKAIHCDDCFLKKLAIQSKGNIPQPRWIGPLYKKTMPRILVMLLNPGSGKGYKKYQETGTVPLNDPLNDYKEGNKSLEEYFYFQRKDMEEWGHGKFVRFYEKWLGLNFNKVAFANIAWCATENNNYPNKMLNNCYQKFTNRLIQLLKPTTIVLSGVTTWGYEKILRSADDDIRVIKMWHYANRKSENENKNHIIKVKQIL
tara:strand:+ start:145 stop:786 length:642 start_codon:yes stop_codon:yes gene_type:complete